MIKIDYCTYPQGFIGKRRNRIFSNNEKGVIELLTWLIKFEIQPDEIIAIIEATSAYYENLIRFVDAQFTPFTYF